MTARSMKSASLAKRKLPPPPACGQATQGKPSRIYSRSKLHRIKELADPRARSARWFSATSALTLFLLCVPQKLSVEVAEKGRAVKAENSGFLRGPHQYLA